MLVRIFVQEMKTAINRVVICDRNHVHATRFRQAIYLFRRGIAIHGFERFHMLGLSAEVGVAMQVGLQVRLRVD